MWQLPVSIRGLWLFCLKKYLFFYPIPTHSRHNLIALPSTMAASPLAAPKVSMLTPVIRKKPCKILLYFNCLSLPSSAVSGFVDRLTLLLYNKECKISVKRLKKMRVMIVEDEKEICDTVAKRLYDMGYEVDTCYDGNAALEYVLAENYDLIVLDLNLPGRDGMDILRELRRKDEETKVLILSARSQIADKVSGVFVPVVITVACITTVVWLLLGREFAYALARGISVLVISCPCALGLATPVAIMVGNGLGAKNGILFKTAVSLEETGKMQIVALDKTGTITEGEPVVTDLIPVEGISETELLTVAYALEQKSEHPLAKAVIKRGQERSVDKLEVQDFTALPGNGLSAVLDGQRIVGGSMTFIKEKSGLSEAMQEICNRLAQEGKTPLLFTLDDKLIGVIAVADTIKKDSREAIRQLKNMGIHVVMLTGDNERTARAIGAEAGVDEVIAGVLPDGKESVIRKLKEQGKTAMVGDGINDAPALTRADMGIAIGAGADVAIDAADVVLMKSSLRDVAAAIRLSRATLRNIHENLFWAFIYNIIGIPLAAGAWVHFGLTLNPMFGAAAMSLSSFCVVSNALRLNFCRLHDASRDKKIKSAIIKDTIMNTDSQEESEMESGKEGTTMTKTMKIEGMMCGHCEARVKKVLEALAEVDSAEVSHEAGTAVVTLNSDVQDEVLKKTVEDQDYKVTSIQ